jgi:hypothetical protein
MKHAKISPEDYDKDLEYETWKSRFYVYMNRFRSCFVCPRLREADKCMLWGFLSFVGVGTIIFLIWYDIQVNTQEVKTACNFKHYYASTSDKDGYGNDGNLLLVGISIFLKVGYLVFFFVLGCYHICESRRLISGDESLNIEKYLWMTAFAVILIHGFCIIESIVNLFMMENISRCTRMFAFWWYTAYPMFICFIILSMAFIFIAIFIKDKLTFFVETCYMLLNSSGNDPMNAEVEIA